MPYPKHYPTAFRPVDLEQRHQPAKYCPVQRGWFQDGRKVRNVKASKVFVWPKDGRNGSTWGRLKDIWTNSGPDMYLTFNADKHDYMHNRPPRAQWSGHENIDDTGLENTYPFSSRRWTRTGWLGGRMPGLSYDFRTRKYGIPNRHTYTDAVWQPAPRKNKDNKYPEAIRDVNGRWWQDYHYVPQWRNGPISNEQGKGHWEEHRQPVWAW